MATQDFNEELLRETVEDSFESNREQFENFIGIYETYVIVVSRFDLVNKGDCIQ